MSIYVVRADGLLFSAEQLGAVARLHSCRDLGGITEGVAWVRDNDDDIIILACERMEGSHYMLLPRCHHLHHFIEFARVAERIDAAGWYEIVTPSKFHGCVNVGLQGGALLLWYDVSVMNQKAINVNDAKLNIRYKEGDDNDSN